MPPRDIADRRGLTGRISRTTRRTSRSRRPRDAGRARRPARDRGGAGPRGRRARGGGGRRLRSEMSSTDHAYKAPHLAASMMGQGFWPNCRRRSMRRERRWGADSGQRGGCQMPWGGRHRGVRRRDRRRGDGRGGSGRRGDGRGRGGRRRRLEPLRCPQDDRRVGVAGLGRKLPGRQRPLMRRRRPRPGGRRWHCGSVLRSGLPVIPDGGHLRERRGGGTRQRGRRDNRPRRRSRSEIEARGGRDLGRRRKCGCRDEHRQTSSAPSARPNAEIDPRLLLAGVCGRDVQRRLRQREWRLNRWARDRLRPPHDARRRCDGPLAGAPEGRREKRDPQGEDHLPQGGATRWFHDRDPRMAGEVRSVERALRRGNARGVAGDAGSCSQKVGTPAVSARPLRTEARQRWSEGRRSAAVTRGPSVQDYRTPLAERTLRRCDLGALPPSCRFVQAYLAS